MADAVIARKEPFAITVAAGRKYYWCACGRSAKQPFCDGSHKGTAFGPVEFAPIDAGTIYFCGCKRTGSKPLCDGTHSRL